MLARDCILQVLAGSVLGGCRDAESGARTLYCGFLREVLDRHADNCIQAAVIGMDLRGAAQA